MADVIKRACFVLFAVMVYGAAGAWLSSVVPAGAEAEPADLQIETRDAIDAFFAAVLSGEPDKVAAVLAPEFQIQRADGSHYDAKDYPDSVLPIIAEVPVIQDLVVSATGDSVVATYVVNVNETLDGSVVEANAPRMTVFRKEGGTWLVVAHANFAGIER